MTLRIQLFGGFRVWQDQQDLTPAFTHLGKPKDLLKIFVLHPGRVFTRDELIEWLWPEYAALTAEANLRKRISELRQTLEPSLPRGDASQYILTRPNGYCFNSKASYTTDAQEFLQRWESGQKLERAGQIGQASREYEAAAALVQGDFLADDRYEDWAQELSREWEERVLTLFERLAGCYAHLGQYAQAIEQCQRGLQVRAWREGLHRQKMLYQYRASQHSEALQTYHACVQALQDHLQTKPGPETQTLYEQIVKREVSALLRAVLHNLPCPLTSFVGRERELREVKQLLADTRLLTLIGAGGSGKTRLALRLGMQILQEYPDGVWWVELAGLTDSQLVPQAVATVLGIRETAGQPLVATLAETLRAKNLLLILDNCEHLVRACAHLVNSLLQVCPQVQIVATSREVLGIVGETIWSVPPLITPTLRPLPALKILQQFEAVALFAERAKAIQPKFRLTAENAMSVSQICTDLEGMPLAIELAAARVKMLSVEQIAARLDDRFRLLTEGSRTALPQHQTLRATMDWSYHLLAEEERELLRRLSVFAGGFSLDELEAVCARKPLKSVLPRPLESDEILDVLVHLVDKSLVIVEEMGKKARYRLLETVKQYAREKLRESGEAESAHERHLTYFTGLAEQMWEVLDTLDQPQWFDRLEMEHDDLRAALAWALERRKTEAALKMAKGLWRFWLDRGYVSEARDWLRRVLDQGQGLRTELYARVLNGAGRLACVQGDYATARTFHEQTLGIYQELGDKRGIASQYINLGVIASYQSDHRLACSLYEKAVPIFRGVGNRVGLANALANLGAAACEQGDYALARARLEEALNLRREMGDQQSIADELAWLAFVDQQEGNYERAIALRRESLALYRALDIKRGVADALQSLGWIAFAQGDYPTAHTHYEEALVMHQELGNQKAVASLLISVADLAFHEGLLDRALRVYKESLALHHRMGIKDGLSRGLRGLGRIAAIQKRFERAVRLCGAAAALREASGVQLAAMDRADYEEQVATVRTALGQEAFTKLWDHGRAMTLEEAVAYALKE